MAEHRASCQCGALVVQAAADPDFVVVCNCRACQRRTGAAFGTGGYFRREVLTIEGASRVWARTADTGRALENHFCPACGTTVFWTLEMRPDYLGVALGCFDGPLPEPSRAVWTEAKHDWVRFPDHWPTFEKGTPD